MDLGVPQGRVGPHNPFSLRNSGSPDSTPIPAPAVVTKAVGTLNVVSGSPDEGINVAHFEASTPRFKSCQEAACLQT